MGEREVVIDESESAITPETEPQPLLTIDRLVRVGVRPTERSDVYVTLQAACVGTMADVAGMRSCIDTEAVLAPLQDALTSAPERPATVDPIDRCAKTPRVATAGLFDDEVCDPWSRHDEVCSNKPRVLFDPLCKERSSDGDFRTARGGDWFTGGGGLARNIRSRVIAGLFASPEVGFRCARRSK